MTPNGKKYTIQYYNALSGQLLPAYTQYNSKPELILPPLSGDASCPIVYFVVRNTSKSTNDNDTVFPAEYAKLLNENFNFFTSTEPSAIENNSTQEIIVYPNPTNDILHIRIPDGIIDAIINLYTIDGIFIKIKEVEFATGETEINISMLPAGIYLIHVFNESISQFIKFGKL